MKSKFDYPLNAKLRKAIESAVTQNTQAASKICDTIKESNKKISLKKPQKLVH